MRAESYIAEARAMLAADGFPSPMIEAALFGLAPHADALAARGDPVECIRVEAFAMAMRVADALFPPVRVLPGVSVH